MTARHTHSKITYLVCQGTLHYVMYPINSFIFMTSLFCSHSSPFKIRPWCLGKKGSNILGHGAFFWSADFNILDFGFEKYLSC